VEEQLVLGEDIVEAPPAPEEEGGERPTE